MSSESSADVKDLIVANLGGMAGHTHPRTPLGFRLHRSMIQYEYRECGE